MNYTLKWETPIRRPGKPGWIMIGKPDPTNRLYIFWITDDDDGLEKLMKIYHDKTDDLSLTFPNE